MIFFNLGTAKHYLDHKKNAKVPKLAKLCVLYGKKYAGLNKSAVVVTYISNVSYIRFTP